jgi:hypothetical protein
VTTGSAADTPASLGWATTCPSFEREDCRNDVADCGGIATCLTSVDAAVVDQGIALAYDDLVAPSVGDPTLNRCQRAIGKAVTTILAATSRALQRC